MSWLLDVNVLIAILDEDHIHHSIASDWLSKYCENGWATCPITENGIVRILSNPAYGLEGSTPKIVNVYFGRLKKIYPHHKFIADSYPLDDGTINFDYVLNSKQLTDAYLTGLAYRESLKFVTFDKGVKSLYLMEKPEDIIVLL